jgi:hypothetical protein
VRGIRETERGEEYEKQNEALRKKNNHLETILKLAQEVEGKFPEEIKFQTNDDEVLLVVGSKRKPNERNGMPWKQAMDWALRTGAIKKNSLGLNFAQLKDATWLSCWINCNECRHLSPGSDTATVWVPEQNTMSIIERGQFWGHTHVLQSYFSLLHHDCHDVLQRKKKYFYCAVQLQATDRQSLPATTR